MLDHFGFQCDSRAEVDHIAELARQQNILVEPPTDVGGVVGYFTTMRDPDGHLVEFTFGQPLKGLSYAVTLRAAKELLLAWQELNDKTYDAFCRMMPTEKQLLIQSLLDAQKLAGNPQKHWTEKAFAWERWQELRSKYSVRHGSELS